MNALILTGGVVMTSVVGHGLHAVVSAMAMTTENELATRILDALAWHCNNDDSENSNFDLINGCYAPKAEKCQDEWKKALQEHGRGGEITLSAAAQIACGCECHA